MGGRNPLWMQGARLQVASHTLNGCIQKLWLQLSSISKEDAGQVKNFDCSCISGVIFCPGKILFKDVVVSLSSALEHVCSGFEKVDLLGYKYSSVFYRESPIDTEEVSKEPDNCKEAQTLYMEIQNKIHFIGIGGIGMSGVAAICINS